MKKIVALVLAVMMLLSVFAFAEEEKTVMTHDEYVAAEMDTEVTVETYVQAHQSWWDGKITIYAQSEDGAYFLYNAACAEEDAEKLVTGTKIIVTGYKSEWAGEVEIVDATFEIVEDAEPWIAEPVDVTDLLGTDELINHQNELVAFTGMTVESYTYQNGDEIIDTEAAFSYGWDGSGAEGANSDLYFNVSVNGETYTFTVESYLCPEGMPVYENVKLLNIGDVIDLEGFLYWYNGVNPHIIAIPTMNG